MALWVWPCQPPLMPLLALRGARHHPSFDEVNDQRSFGPITDVDRRPGLCGQRGAATDRDVARDAAGGGPDRWTLGAGPPGHESTCCQEPPADNAPTDDRVGDETSTDVPSRHHRRSNDAAASSRVAAACPTPTGVASDTLGGLGARPLCPDAPCPGSILWADTGACRPGYGPRSTHSPE